MVLRLFCWGYTMFKRDVYTRVFWAKWPKKCVLVCIFVCFMHICLSVIIVEVLVEIHTHIYMWNVVFNIYIITIREILPPLWNSLWINWSAN